MKRVSLFLVSLWMCAAGSVGAADNLQNTLENNRTNQASTWVNPDTGERMSTVPTQTFQNAAGEPCREFTEAVTIAGEKQQAYGTACRQPDGSWRIVNDQPVTKREVQAQQPQVVYVPQEPVQYAYPYDYWPYYPYPYYYPFSLGLSFGYVFGGGHGGGHGWGGGHGEHR